MQKCREPSAISRETISPLPPLPFPLSPSLSLFDAVIPRRDRVFGVGIIITGLAGRGARRGRGEAHREDHFRGDN